MDNSENRRIVTSKDGVRYYIMTNLVDKGEFYTDGDVCYKIEVPDDVNEVRFESPKVMIAEDLSFPNVESLIIGEHVQNIVIRNTLFPNVKNVVSYSPFYISSKYLVRKNHSVNIIENIFCQDSDSVIDLDGITSVETHAFDDCKATEIINDEDVSYLMLSPGRKPNSAFFNKKPPKNGYIAIGNTLISVDEKADHLDIPKRISNVFRGIRLKNVKEMVIHDFDILCLLDCMPRKLIIADDTPDMIDDSLNYIKGLNQFYVSPKNKHYSTVDGVLFDKYKTTLIRYPGAKTGRYRVPDGVVKINNFAFASSDIDHVTLSDSVKDIGYGAFCECKRLKSVNFGSGITTIGKINAGMYNNEGMFYGCKNLKQVVIPKQVTTINEYVFCESGLEKVALNEGLETLGSMAFANCNIKEIKLPQTLSHFGSGCLLGIEHIIMAKGVDYETLANAIVYYGQGSSLDGKPEGVFFTQGNESVYVQTQFWNSAKFTSIEAIKKYERRSYTSFAVNLIYYEDYESLFKMIDTNDYNHEELKTLLDIAEETEDITASAYILEKMKEKESDNYDI